MGAESNSLTKSHMGSEFRLGKSSLGYTNGFSSTKDPASLASISETSLPSKIAKGSTLNRMGTLEVSSHPNFSKVIKQRSYTKTMNLMNLFHGVIVKPKGKDQNLSTPMKLLVAEGNNGRLVDRMIKAKGCVVSESFYSKCNLQWT